MYKHIIAFGIILASASTVHAAQTPDTSYLGSWTITSALVAPWMPAGEMPDSTEKSALMGKSIVLRTGEIAGPAPFPCKNPHYDIKDFTADMLFQGGLGEMHSKNAYANPKTLAEGLGFHGKSWKTLQTGCEIDFHFADPATLEFALNNYIYTLKKN